MALTITQLELLRRYYERNIGTVSHTEPQINAAAQAMQTWVEANRGSLPNSFDSSALTAPQRNQVSNAVDATGFVFTNTQKNVLFDGVARLNEIVVVVPDPAADPVVIQAIRQRFFNLFDAAIDAARPGLTNDEKRRALRNALDFD